MSQPTDLPPYIRQASLQADEAFLEVLISILIQWLNSNGFLIPSLTDAQIAAFAAGASGGISKGLVATGRLVYNSTNDVLQYINSSGTVNTITAT